MIGPTDRPLWKQSREYNPANEGLKSFGKPYKNIPYNHRLLNLDYLTPQQYNSLIQNWEQLIIQEWAKLANKEETDMFAYLETFFGETAHGLYMAYKTKHPDKLNNIKAMGNNPNNFTNLIRIIVMGTIPQADIVIQQDQAIRNPIIKEGYASLLKRGMPL